MLDTETLAICRPLHADNLLFTVKYPHENSLPCCHIFDPRMGIGDALIQTLRMDNHQMFPGFPVIHTPGHIRWRIIKARMRWQYGVVCMLH
jgi:hypothetical protein